MRGKLAPIALLAIAAACSRQVPLTVVVASTTLQPHPGPVERTVDRVAQATPAPTVVATLGDRLTGHRPWFGTPAYLQVDVAGHAAMYVRAADVAVYPLQGEWRWVQRPILVLGPIEGGTPTIGTKVRAVDRAPWLAAGSAALVQDGVVAAFVDSSALIASPTVDGELAASRAALDDGRVAEALLYARFAHTLGANRDDAAGLLAALDDAAGDPAEAEALRKSLPAASPAATTPAATASVEGAAEVFVAATSVAIRSAPSTSSKVLARVPIGAQLDPSGSPQDGWLKVTVDQSPPRRDYAKMDASGSIQDAGDDPIEGWASTAFLSPARPEVADLLARAAVESSAGRLASAAALFDRALALDPSNASVSHALLATAFASSQWDAIAHAARALSRRPALAVLDVNPAYRCRSDDLAAAKFVTVDPGGTPPATAGNACLIDFEEEPPCLGIEICGDEPLDAKARADLKKVEAANQKFSDWLDRLHAKFPSGPYLVLDLQGGSGAIEQGQSVLVYSARVPSKCEEEAEDTPRYSDVQVHRVWLPPLPGDHPLRVALDVDAYAGVEFGAFVTTADEAAVQRYLESAGDAEADDPLAGAPGRKVTTPGRPECCCD